MMQPTAAEYAEMSWHARRRLAHRLKLAEMKRHRKTQAAQAAPFVIAAAQRVLDQITPDDPADVAARREWVAGL
jgi:hypothetical protein